jgi:galactoside O-acetyltransferase
MNSTSFLTEEEVGSLGLKSYGLNVKISRWARFYSASEISIGSNVRIDDYCLLSGNINLGSYIHISSYCGLFGSAGIEIRDFAGLSPRVTIFSESDDFNGEHMVGPMIPNEFRGVTSKKVTISKYVQIGAGSVVMPGVILNEGCAVAALSYVNCSFDSWKIIGGIPARVLKARNHNIIGLSQKMRNDCGC